MSRQRLHAQDAARSARRLRSAAGPSAHFDAVSTASASGSGTRIVSGVGGCLYQKLDFAIMVMKPAEDGHRYEAARVLDGAMDRSAFVERPMSSTRCSRRTPQRIVCAHPPDRCAQLRVDLRPASKAAGFPAPAPAEAARCHRTRVSGRMIVTALRTHGNHRYSWTENKRSPFVSWIRPHTFRCNTIS